MNGPLAAKEHRRGRKGSASSVLSLHPSGTGSCASMSRDGTGTVRMYSQGVDMHIEIMQPISLPRAMIATCGRS